MKSTSRKNFAWLIMSTLLAATERAEKYDYINWDALELRVGDTILPDGSRGQDSTYADKLSDRNDLTGILIPASLPEEQYITLDLTSYDEDLDFKGVWLHTDEANMSAGTVSFSVDGVPCPDTNGIGVDAIGGAFNCNLKGRSLEISCTETCSPYLAV